MKINILGWIILAFVALLLIGRRLRQSPSHPANALAVTGVTGVSTAGDSFDTCATVAAGQPETSVSAPIAHPPLHIFFPIAPVPIAIQRPIVAAPVYPNGTVVKGSGPEVDIIHNGMRRWIPNPATFTAMGLNWGNVVVMPDAAFNAIKKGTAMPDLTPKAVPPRKVSIRPPIRPQIARRAVRKSNVRGVLNPPNGLDCNVFGGGGFGGGGSDSPFQLDGTSCHSWTF